MVRGFWGKWEIEGRTPHLMPPRKPSPPPPLKPPPDRDDLAGWRAYLSQVESELKREGLCLPESGEWVDLERNVASRMYASRFHYRFPRTRDLIQTPEAAAGYLFRMGTDPWIRERALCDRLTDLAASRISDIFSASPRDLKDSHLQALLREGFFGTCHDERLPNFNSAPVPEHFEYKPLVLRARKTAARETYDPKLAPVAFLITRDLVREDMVETYLPELTFKDFQGYQSKIHRDVEETLPERFQRFSVYWKSLTTAQKKALRLTHMAPERSLTYLVAAQTLGITKDALKERLKGAVKKLKDTYPELTPIRGMSRSVWKPKDLDEMRFLNLARARVPTPVTRVEPVSGNRSAPFDQAKATTRTPVANLAARILEWERTRYDPDHDGVGSPRLAHMRATPASRSGGLRPEVRKTVAATAAGLRVCLTGHPQSNPYGTEETG